MGVRVSIPKEPYSFVIFQGKGSQPPGAGAFSRDFTTIRPRSAGLLAGLCKLKS